MMPLPSFSSRFRRTVQLGIRSLWLHRLRSLLTVLGIVFGVCSVIAMLAIGEGASYEAQQQIKNLGSQNILLKSVKPAEEEKVSNRQQNNFALEYGLKQEDIRRIRDTIPGIELVVPARVIRDYVWNITHRVDAEIVGTLPNHPATRNQSVAQGRFFNDLEMDAAAPVCVLGHDVALKLFPAEEALGRDVRVGLNYYRVIGIMEPRARSAASEASIDGPAANAALGRIFIPLETARRRYGEILSRRRGGTYEAEKVALHEITVRVRRPETVIAISEVVKDILARHHTRKDYEVVVPLELLRRAERTKQIFNLVLGSIAAISLLVGGIGIMNIMLANVTERTREIGIRRALGARRKDIITQFLVESVLLSGSGGLIGVALGIAIPFAVSALAHMKVIITPWSPIAAFTLSAMVGILFGIYPARRAAALDPVEALRHE